MDENVYLIIREIHDNLSKLNEFDSQNSKLIMAGEIAKLRTLLMFFGDVSGQPNLEEHKPVKFMKRLIG